MLNRSICPLNGSITHSITLGKDIPGSNSKEREHSTLLRSPVLEPHHQMQFSVIQRTPLLDEVLTLCRGWSHSILAPPTEQSSCSIHVTKEQDYYPDDRQDHNQQKQKCKKLVFKLL